ncbi:Hypothetical protein NTJ_03371 [Nesidiocoris tenuis]|uniref:Uncharacterized protein n=1 Tax=Nesidiocoris tenuis TaxID=355587 RepID=A0ABN7AE57_9HEMI|nr:Hypothetical protein NTJ_03371 [Nesidiocoris tenuis]
MASPLNTLADAVGAALGAILEEQAEQVRQQQEIAVYIQDVVRQTLQESLRNNELGNRNANNTVPEFKSKHADLIPVFTGDPRSMEYFLTQCEMIVDWFVDPYVVDCFQNKEVLGAIIRKIQGLAATMIATYKFDSFAQIREALLGTYADKRDIYTLNHELVALQQKDYESPFTFHQNVTQILNLIVAYLKTRVTDQVGQELFIEH